MKKNIFFKLGVIIFILSVFPITSFALGPQFGGDGNGSSSGSTVSNTTTSGAGFCDLASDPKFDTLVNYITCMITSAIVPLLFTLAFALFIWGVIQYTLNDTEEAKRAKGKQFMIWGIIALTVMFSVWGIVAIFGETFGIDTKLIPQVAD